MQVINYYDSNWQPHWLEKIRSSDWSAGALLAELISNGTFFDAVGEEAKIFLLT